MIKHRLIAIPAELVCQQLGVFGVGTQQQVTTGESFVAQRNAFVWRLSELTEIVAILDTVLQPLPSWWWFGDELRRDRTVL